MFDLGYSGYIPSIMPENVFGESYGKTTAKSVQGAINKGFETHPTDKFKSITASKFTNQSEQLREMRPADVFEPGYDTVTFASPENQNHFKSKF